MKLKRVLTTEEADRIEASIKGVWATITPPPLEFSEARKVFKKLYRFVGHGAYKWPIVHNNRGDTWQYEHNDPDDLNSYFSPRRAAAGAKYEFRINTSGGWPEFVRHIAVFCGSDRTNDMELQMVQEVLKRGWLDGRLQDRLIPPDERKAIARSNKIKSIKTRIERWESKERRAKNALRKLRTQLKRMEKTT